MAIFPNIWTETYMYYTPKSSIQIIELKPQIRIHSNLGLAVYADERPNIHRAFSVWSTLRSTSQTHFDFNQVLDFYSELTGNHPRNVRRWLDAGEGLFFIRGSKNRLSLIGKNRVFAAFNLSTPGQVQLVDTDRLTGKLSTLRASLYSLWQTKDKKWISRKTIKELSGTPERTQRHYDTINQQQKQKMFAINWFVEGGIKQLPNIYKRLHFTNEKREGRKYNLFARNQTGELSDTEKPMRLLFNSATAADNKARQRSKQGMIGQCFYLSDTTPSGNILVKAIDYEAI